jgi:hypothetical protein
VGRAQASPQFRVNSYRLPFGGFTGKVVRITQLNALAIALFFLALAVASVNAQAPSQVQTGGRSPLAEIAHDFSNWFTRVTGTDGNRHRERSLPLPLPRPRPPELTSAPVPSNKEPSELTAAPVSSNKEPSELTAAPASPKKKAPASVLIND